MTLNVITGMPRSGSTLLCDILNQNPKVFASSTSTLAQAMNKVSGVLTESETSSSELLALPGSYDRHLHILRSLALSWHAGLGEIVFDKGRAWSQSIPLLQAAFPKSLSLVTIRDPRDVFASIEREHIKTGQYGTGTQIERFHQMFSNEGIIGCALVGIEDIIRRQPQNVLFLDYAKFVAEPSHVLKAIYAILETEEYEHDYEEIQSTSYDFDAQWRFKFPHRYEGTRPVTPSTKHWSDILGSDVASEILKISPLYVKTFGYV